MKIRGNIAPAPTTPRFELGFASEGYEVVDRDGRAVTGVLRHGAALEALATLNYAALGGAKALATALGAVDDDF